jgi:hypothetical protein
LGGSLLSLIFPFLTQSIVDVGIQNQGYQLYLHGFACPDHAVSAESIEADPKLDPPPLICKDKYFHHIRFLYQADETSISFFDKDDRRYHAEDQ